MNFKDYQKQAWKTAIYPQKGTDLTYPTLGLAGEAGEVAEKVKKLIRDKNGKIDKEFCLTLVDELGDVLWYVAAICQTIEVDIEHVANRNLEKLQSRQDRNKIKGDGDDR